MAWFFLILAGLFEIAFAICLKLAIDYPWRGLIVLSMILGGISVGLLYKAASEIPIGTAYAVWTGIGAIGVAGLGMIFFGESRHPLRWACIALVVLGIIGLELTFNLGKDPSAQ